MTDTMGKEQNILEVRRGPGPDEYTKRNGDIVFGGKDTRVLWEDIGLKAGVPAGVVHIGPGFFESYISGEKDWATPSQMGPLVNGLTFLMQPDGAAVFLGKLSPKVTKNGYASVLSESKGLTASLKNPLVARVARPRVNDELREETENLLNAAVGLINDQGSEARLNFREANLAYHQAQKLAHQRQRDRKVESAKRSAEMDDMGVKANDGHKPWQWPKLVTNVLGGTVAGATAAGLPTGREVPAFHAEHYDQEVVSTSELSSIRADVADVERPQKQLGITLPLPPISFLQLGSREVPQVVIKAMSETQLAAKSIGDELGPVVSPTATAESPLPEGDSPFADYFASVDQITFYPESTEVLANYTKGVKEVGLKQNISVDGIYMWGLTGEGVNGQDEFGLITVVYDAKTEKVYGVFSIGPDGKLVPSGTTADTAFVELHSQVVQINGKYYLVLGNLDQTGGLHPLFQVQWDRDKETPVGDWAFISPFGGVGEDGFPLEGFSEDLAAKIRARLAPSGEQSVDLGVVLTADQLEEINAGGSVELDLNKEYHASIGYNDLEYFAGQNIIVDTDDDKVVAMFDIDTQQWVPVEDIDNYFDMGRVWRVFQEVSAEDLTDEYMNGQLRVKDNLIIAPQSAFNIVRPNGSLQRVLLQNLTLTNFERNALIFEEPGERNLNLQGEELMLTFVYRDGNGLHRISMTSKGLLGNGNSEIDMANFSSLYDLGQQVDVSLHIIPLDSDGITSEQWADFIFGISDNDQEAIDRLIGFSGFGEDQISIEEIIRYFSGLDVVLSEKVFRVDWVGK